MKVWDEDEILEELIAARLAADKKHSNNNNNNRRLRRKEDETQYEDAKLPFLLILVRKMERNCSQFLYYPAENFQRIDDVFQFTEVVIEGNSSLAAATDDEVSSSSDEEDSGVQPRLPFEPYYVGKAIFHTASGETLLKIDGSTGWKEALKQKYHALDAKCKAAVDEKAKGATRNHTAAKAVASAAIGGGAMAGGTSLAAAGMGYSATGITAGSYAAGIMSAEAIASGGGVAAGGFTATMQSIGAAGVMASAAGMTLVGGGAIAGLAVYYGIHRRNKKRAEQQQKTKREQEDQLAAAATTTGKEEEEGEAAAGNEYQKLSEDESEHLAEPLPEKVNYWVMVTAKRVELEESQHFFDHEAWEDRLDADQAFLEMASNTAAKGVFNPRGVLTRVDCDPADREGWETALRLHYHYLVEQDLLPTTPEKHGEHATEGTPLLEEEKEENVQVKTKAKVKATTRTKANTKAQAKASAITKR